MLRICEKKVREGPSFNILTWHFPECNLKLLAVLNIIAFWIPTDFWSSSDFSLTLIAVNLCHWYMWDIFPALPGKHFFTILRIRVDWSLTSVNSESSIHDTIVASPCISVNPIPWFFSISVARPTDSVNPISAFSLISVAHSAFSVNPSSVFSRISVT